MNKMTLAIAVVEAKRFLRAAEAAKKRHDEELFILSTYTGSRVEDNFAWRYTKEAAACNGFVNVHQRALSKLRQAG